MIDTRDLGNMSPVELQIVERSRKYRGEALTNLHQYVSLPSLHEHMMGLNQQSSAGVDGLRWEDYVKESPIRLPQLLQRFKSGSYKAPHIRRVHIPKEGGKRPLGIPTIEDKVLQSNVNRILELIYEDEFYDFSYGFRKGRQPHQAINAVSEKVSFKQHHYIIDADIRSYFDTINHNNLRNFLDYRIKDGVIRKMIDKWLQAGILEDEQLRYPEEGAPQGGTISPLLSNIYLHYVLDEWFTEQIQPLLKGKSFMVRYADDFVMGFTNMEDAQRVLKVLPKRFSKYGLSLHSDKTHLLDLSKQERGKRSFDFLGFTHYLEQSRQGKMVLKRRTRKKKLQLAIGRIGVWIRNNRHLPLKDLITKINRRLVGHYNYYGITFNSRGLDKYFMAVKRLLYKWLNRRGGKRAWSWERITLLTEYYIPLTKPRIYHSYQRTKPN